MRRFLAIIVVLLALAGVTAHADVAMSVEGEVHSVRSEHFSAPQGEVGTLLLHRRQLSDGTTIQAAIEGTTDLAVDTHPMLAVVGERLVLVWSRDEGDGVDLYQAVWQAGSWSAPELLISRSNDTENPTLRHDGRLIHVVWSESGNDDDDDGNRWFRIALNDRNLRIQFGPEELPGGNNEADLVPINGEDGVSTEPSPDLTYMAGEVEAPGSDSGAIFVWGIRDEPIPIDFNRGFHLPDDVRDVQDIRAEWLGGRLTLTFVHARTLYYTAYESGSWSDQKLVLLEGNLSADAARRLILESAEASALSEGMQD
ncbi:hypothetical protein ABI59_05715 [Acidobacteria bacterium Mor1]|nr:hypothetical protein ABI59_05715 [Acidobacteria bacterium Mor1]